MKPKLALRDLIEEATEPTSGWPAVSSSLSPRAAAQILAEARAPGVRVEDGGRVLGVVTAHSLLGMMLRDDDPATGLPRSGPLRDWLGSCLREGQEVSLLFFDIDSFGELNRRQGHAAGDAALAAVASILAGICSAEDFCARFGGDEFAIGTRRNRSAAEDLAQEAVRALANEGHPVSVGVSGGRREKTREDSNVGATVEDLIQLASLACMSQKQARGREPF